MTDYLFPKVLFFCNEGVGKTTFSKKYCVGFDLSYKRTIGANIFKLKQDVKFQGDNASLCFWDISDHFYPANIMFKSAHGGIIMYDITNRSSLSKIPEWSNKIRQFREDIPILLVGNKLDLEENREISRDYGIMIKEENSLSSFIEISVETGENVDNMLEILVNLMIN